MKFHVSLFVVAFGCCGGGGDLPLAMNVIVVAGVVGCHCGSSVVRLFFVVVTGVRVCASC